MLDIGGGENYINSTAVYQVVPQATKTIQIRDPNTAALNLVSDANTDKSTLGGIMFSRSGGQSDAHYNVAGINAIEVQTGDLAGGTLQFYAKPYGTAVTSPRMVISSTGNVGIGTSSPANMLSVAGTVQAYEVVVNNSWSDYVFSPQYRLMPLDEVAGYIKANGHLPEIPSAKEVEEKGVSVGDMQAKLLAKIEELTLHMITAEGENRELRERVRKLEAAGKTNASPANQ